MAVVIDYASRMVRNPQQLSEAEHKFFVEMEKLSYDASARFQKGSRNVFLYNPVFWLVNRERDLPLWFTAGNNLLRTVTIPLPDFAQRRNMAELNAPWRPAHLSEEFAKQTEGMTLRSMASLIGIIKDQKLPPEAIEDAVRSYRVGIPENPWKKPHIRDRIKGAKGHLRKSVRGQDEAISQACDVLVRSTMGLTGAHSQGHLTRPRGTLLFAGPTGVGKTELAKAIAGLIFEREDAYIRFDMSEFSAEHTDARLIGAPPGYVGFDAGGELTNAVRERPFSLILFDEIEKAHPSILDKFLQILEDGRLTDGTGNTVFFSEALLVFTSNLGLYDIDKDGNRHLAVRMDIERKDLSERINDSMKRHFRPELLNRIGLDNIVTFNFINPDVAEVLVDDYLVNIQASVLKQHRLNLDVDSSARATLVKHVKKEEFLEYGGRGIGTALYKSFIDPLSHALLESPLNPGGRIQVTDIIEQGDAWRVVLHETTT